MVAVLVSFVCVCSLVVVCLSVVLLLLRVGVVWSRVCGAVVAECPLFAVQQLLFAVADWRGRTRRTRQRALFMKKTHSHRTKQSSIQATRNTHNHSTATDDDGGDSTRCVHHAACKRTNHSIPPRHIARSCACVRSFVSLCACVCVCVCCGFGAACWRPGSAAEIVSEKPSVRPDSHTHTHNSSRQRPHTKQDRTKHTAAGTTAADDRPHIPHTQQRGLAGGQRPTSSRIASCTHTRTRSRFETVSGRGQHTAQHSTAQDTCVARLLRRSLFA